jgi:hypothetical protein
MANGVWVLQLHKEIFPIYILCTQLSGVAPSSVESDLFHEKRNFLQHVREPGLSVAHLATETLNLSRMVSGMDVRYQGRDVACGSVQLRLCVLQLTSSPGRLFSSEDRSHGINFKNFVAVKPF